MDESPAEAFIKVSIISLLLGLTSLPPACAQRNENFAAVSSTDDLGSFAPTHPVDPAFAKLKPYRTYYHIAGIQPYAQQFLVHFMVGSDPVLATFHADTVDEIQAQKNIPTVTGVLATGTLTPTTTPPDQLSLETAVRAKVKELYPTSSQLILAYQGEIRRIDVVETIVISSSTVDLFQRIAHLTTLHFSQKKGLPGLILDRGVAQSNVTDELCDRQDQTSCMVRPNFIPFLSAPDAEGRSAFAYSMYRSSTREDLHLKFPELDRELDRLWPMILTTVNDLDAGNYTNPIEAILQKQFSGLPAKLQTFFNQGVICGGTPIESPRTAEKTHTVSFGFTLDQLLKGLNTHIAMEEFGLDVSLQASDKAIHLVVRKPTGERIDFARQMTNIEDSLIAGNGSLAPRNGNIKTSPVTAGNDPAAWQTFPDTKAKQGMNFRCRLTNPSLSIRPEGVQMGVFTY